MPAPRIIFLNNYPAEQVIEGCRSGEVAAHHLWGIDHLARRGADIDVVPFRYSPRLERLSLFAGGRLGDLDHQMSAWRVREGATLCYAANPSEVPALAALRLAGFFKVPLAAYFFHPPNHPAWRSLLRGVDLAICLSSRTQSDLRRRFAVPEERTVTVSWGPDLRFAEFRAPPRSGDRVVSTGKTDRDHETVMAALRDAGLPAIVFAHGARSESTRGAGPLTEVVRVAPGGLLPRRAIAEALASARVVVVATRHEIGVNGLTEVLEAMALSRPVVITRNRYYDLDVEAIGCGTIVEPGDPAGLASALRRIWDDPSHADAMGRAGRRFLERSLNYETFGRDLVRALRTVAPI